MNENKLPLFWIKKVEIDISSVHGVGVFATEKINKDCVFERSPVLSMHKDNLLTVGMLHGQESPMTDYIYVASDDIVLVLWGYGSMYNHSDQPNADIFHITDPVEGLTVGFQVYAIRDIEPGEEIFINYKSKGLSYQFNQQYVDFEKQTLEGFSIPESSISPEVLKLFKSNATSTSMHHNPQPSEYPVNEPEDDDDDDLQTYPFADYLKI